MVLLLLLLVLVLYGGGQFSSLMFVAFVVDFGVVVWKCLKNISVRVVCLEYFGVVC